VQAGFRKTIALAAICGATIVGTAAVSAASIDAKGTKKQFCNAAVKVGSDIEPSADPSSYDEEAAAKLEKSFHKLEAKAPNNGQKNAVADISDFYAEIADGDAGDISSGEAKAYAKAVTKFAAFLATQCVSTQIPDITLPDITLP
jgi:hypothetical protein